MRQFPSIVAVWDLCYTIGNASACNTYVNDLALENPVIDIVGPTAVDNQKESIEQQQWLNSFYEENYYLYQRQNECITQRSKTMMDVSRVLLQRQEAFFTHGPNYLKPLLMANIAKTLGIHESTVSRAVSKKYLQCS